MKSKVSILINLVVALLAALALPVQSAAQHTGYKLIDLGTFGGPNSFFPGQFPPAQNVNNRGTVTGAADTPIPDPHCFIDCFIFHAFKWQNGALTDLGVLPHGSVSFADWISASGRIAGNADNGVTDPISGFVENRAVWTKSGQIIDLGTLGEMKASPMLSMIGERWSEVLRTQFPTRLVCVAAERSSEPFCGGTE